jgi:hypothetical protein
MQNTYRPEDFPRIQWQAGPFRLRLTEEVTLQVPEGMAAIQGAEMRRFLEASGNRIEGRELAVAAPADVRWFAIFSRAPAGTARRRAEWVEHFVEPDGRRSVLRTVVLPEGGELLQVEILSEEENASLAAQESELLLRRVEAEVPHSWWWPPAAAAGLAAGWLLLQRRARRSRPPTRNVQSDGQQSAQAESGQDSPDRY